MTIKYVVAAVVTVLFSGVVLLACGGGPQEQNLPLPSDPKNYAPLEKYEAMKIPADNPITQEKANLGWQLWFDKRLSGDGSRSCYGCHVNEKGLTVVPLSLYFKDGRAKVEIALAKGKKTWDKRQSLATRQADREKEQALGRRLKGMD